jgi:hypothetical protein
VAPQEKFNLKKNALTTVFAATAGLFLLTAIGSAPARAQDPAVSDPTHFKLELDNEHVRVLHVTVEPNGKVALHELGGAVVVPLIDYESTLKTADGKSVIVERKTGQAVWLPGGGREIEAGPKGADALLIEIKSASPKK